MSNELQTPSISRGAISVSLNELYPLIHERLKEGQSVSLTITGTSMYPFILGGRDRVTLSPITGDLKKNDLPLYRRKNGAFVLHRIVRVEKDGSYTCCGDHQWQLEKGLRREQMIGIATEYVRKGKHLSNRNLLYRLYRTVWTWVLKARPFFFCIDTYARAIVRRFFRRKNTK